MLFVIIFILLGAQILLLCAWTFPQDQDNSSIQIFIVVFLFFF